MIMPLRRLILMALVAVYVVGFVALLALEVANAAAAGGEFRPANAVLAAGFAALPLVGAVIEWHQPGNRVGRLLLGIGVGVVLAGLAQQWATRALRADPGSLPGARVAAWVAAWLLVPSLGSGPWFFAIFPSGRIETGWLRRLAWVAGAGLAALTVAQAFAPGPIDGVDPGFAAIPNPLGIEHLGPAVGVATTFGVLALVAFLVAGIADLVLRYRRSEGERRLQLRWLALATPVLPISMAVGMVLPPRAGDLVMGVGLPLFLVGTAFGIAVAVLRYRLYELDIFVRRSLVFSALTGLVIGGYVGVVAVAGAVLADRAGPVPSLIAVAVVAVAFQPARARLQRAVDRLVYGRRAEPYAVLTALGERLGTVIAPEQLLQTIVRTVAAELRLDRVAIELNEDFGGATIPSGAPSPDAERFPIVAEGREFGALVVQTRTPGEPLTSTERRLLSGLAGHAASAIRAHELTLALQRSREQLVAVREEDRRRIRRDLHDGLGPALAGLLLRVDIAASVVESDPERARAELSVLKTQLSGATEDIRRLVHDLRPPALDELGLVGALRAQAAALARTDSGGRLTVDVDMPDDTPPLPAAVEVAVLRIAGEALTNVLRHAQAQRCFVHLAVDNAVRLDVEDDGVGIADQTNGGLGLRSMRERARELGGTLDVVPRTDHGTAVRLWLPLQGVST